MNRGWTNSIVNKNEADKASEFYDLMRKQNIGIQFFEDKEPKIDSPEKKGLITIVDVFNIHPTIYRPYIFSEIKKDHRVILYASSIQNL